MTTEMTTTAFDRVDNLVDTVTKLGEMFARSGMFGCEKLEQGQILALACLVERKSPFEIKRTYHLIGGQLCKRADAMLADFNRAGGKHLWDETTNEKAVLRVVYGSFKDYTVSYSIEDAERAGLCGKDGEMKPKQNKPGGWQKTPDAMLRARCVSKCLRMVAPEVVAGFHTPDEIHDEPVVVDVPKPAQPLLESAPTAEPEYKPEKGVDVVEKIKDMFEATVVDKKPDTVEPTLQFVLKGLEADANAWLISKGWIKKGQTFDDLPDDKTTEIFSRIREFKIAIKAFKDAKAVAEAEKKGK